MRRIGSYLLSFLWLLTLPLSAHALKVEFCVPDCSEGNARHTVVSEPGQTARDIATSVTRTTVSVAGVPVANTTHGVTVTATVTSEQSGTLQKITFNPTTITGTAGCTLDSPCRMEILATSEPCDFPTEKPAGGYPAGVFMMGSFTGPQTAQKGDTISGTGEASGATSSAPPTVEACSTSERPAGAGVNLDFINATPGTGEANTGVSLPSSCTGNPLCRFMATTLKKGFSTQITETVQQVCANGAASCLTRLRTRLNAELKTVGNRVSLPWEHVTTNTDFLEPDVTKKKNATKELSAKLAPSFGEVDVRHLAIGKNDFLVTARLRLDSGNEIDPVRDETFFSVGPFSMTILPNKFRRFLQGKLFTFVGRVDGRDVAVTFARSPTDPKVWTFIAGVHNVQLQDIAELEPPREVPVQIGVGTDTGRDLVTARFF